MKSKEYYVRLIDDVLRYMTSANNVIEEFGPKYSVSKDPKKQRIIDAAHYVRCDHISQRRQMQEVIDYILKDETKTDNDGDLISPNYGLADLNEFMDNLKRILDRHDSIRSIVMSVDAFVCDRFKTTLNKKLDEVENELIVTFYDIVYATHGSMFFGGDLVKIAFAARKILYMKYGDFVDFGEYKIIETEKFIVSIIVYSDRFEHENPILDQHTDDVPYTVFKIVQK